MRFAGSLLGVVIMAVVGGIVFVIFTRIRLFGILYATIGGIICYILVKHVLMRYPELHPALRWLFPYDSWTGDE